VIDDPRRLPQARGKWEVTSLSSGYVSAIQCEQVGTACVILGGGRERKEDSVDPAVGIVLHKKVGEKVEAREPLCTIHYQSETRAARAHELLQASYRIAPEPPTEKRPLIHQVIARSAEVI
jgi:pyrimidine-nucleoside phosphorylase